MMISSIDPPAGGIFAPQSARVLVAHELGQAPAPLRPALPGEVTS